MTFIWNVYLATVLIVMMCGCFRIVFKLITMITESFSSTTEILATAFMILVLAAFPMYLLHNGKFAEIFVKAWPF